ncbi:hypothetical protein QEP73_01660 [Pseudomonas defluvii]|nr:hypothetical protein QEP73_01660 [Pseudomonas defluvii]
MLIVANAWAIDSPNCAGLRYPRYKSVFTHSGPKADICPVNKSVPFSLRYIQPKVRMIVDALLEMAQRNAAVFRPD